MIKKIDLKIRIVVILLLVLASFFYVFPTKIKNGDVSIKPNINLGLDLKGGMYILLTADTSEIPKEKISDAIAGAVEKIRHRIDAYGVSEVSIEIQGNKSILVEIPGIVNRAIVDTLQGVGKLEFRLVDDSQEQLMAAISGDVADGYELVKFKKSSLLLSKEVAVSGSDLSESIQGFDMYGRSAINLRFNAEGAKKFAKVTEENIGKRLAITLDGAVMSAPVIQTAILSGNGQIEGDFTPDEARALVSVLNSGALPVPLSLAQERSVGPTLGSDSIKRGINSILLGAALVVGFILIYYLLGGIIAVGCLALNLLFVLAGLNLFQGTLTLPGIAGMILTLGMAVDANVLIFERIREELEAKRPLTIAVKNGFDRAKRTIIDANITTLIAALFLFVFGTGPIKGFATTLSLGIIASVFTSVFVGRTLFAIFLERKVKKLPMLKLVPASHINFVRFRNVALIFSLIIITFGVFSFVARRDNVYGVDFKGGQILEYKLTPLSGIQEVRSVLKDNGFKQIDIQEFTDIAGGVRMRSKEDIGTKIEKVLKSNFDEVEALNVDTISPRVGKILKKKALLAIILSLLGILFYVVFRFKHFDFAFAAVAALFHDVLIGIGFLAFFNQFSSYYEVNLLTITALLTIAGYSINDTIVIYDRIREISPRLHKLSLKEIINVAINNTLSRTIITSLTTIMVVISMYILGGEALRGFSFVLLVGFIAGTYSSIYIAAPLVLLFRKARLHK
ncbi:MAG: protein translocase subunit SecD [Candidatus Omnitrophica bacterium]|nr:protein translocase subunit SecD [Candidatus Omnitrophota bacterium]